MIRPFCYFVNSFSFPLGDKNTPCSIESDFEYPTSYPLWLPEFLCDLPVLPAVVMYDDTIAARLPL